MNVGDPTLDEWKELYIAAEEFRNLQPWTWMSDADLFGVQDPRSREVGYCCVLGALGEVFALCVYRGAEGLAGYRKMQAWRIGRELEDLPFTQKCPWALVGLEVLRQCGHPHCNHFGALGKGLWEFWYFGIEKDAYFFNLSWASVNLLTLLIGLLLAWEKPQRRKEERILKPVPFETSQRPAAPPGNGTRHEPDRALMEERPVRSAPSHHDHHVARQNSLHLPGSAGVS